ncbi:sodium- and chloride-dependent GABA transporter ine-like isoform X2 [Gigantopelta aegis]|uniref:sodium- and chloride-dependent GABA transporter ine-like isoform X2 n=1 Tax=Gigantopelta aegis TaxID=1735272 RepID=UPI001B88C9D2|nr:sodium- and chloride-dependent GABA transporter ine-like isoform X2 [Gigantopelta aegis]
MRAFLIPFFIMLVLCGIPLVYMEMAVGQYTRQGPVGALSKLCPFFKGAGLATVVISFLFTTYYIIIITWSVFYLFNTFQAELPWTTCHVDWSSTLCCDGITNISVTDGSGPMMYMTRNISHTEHNTTTVTTVMGQVADVSCPNHTRSPTEDFYLERVLGRTSGIEEQGVIKWELALILLLCWIIVYFCIWKGPKSTGKVVYFTATFPYVVLVILLVRGVTLPGAIDGIRWFIEPKWSLLLDAKVWVNAAAQTFNSLGVAFGGLVTMSSYSKFNNKILRDVLSLAAVDAFTCLLAGFAIFSILGNLAYTQGKDVEDVISEGPGLVFIIYPQAFVNMPVAPLFAFLFFFMLICLGIDSQFASVEVIVTTISDHFGPQVKKYLKRKEFLVLVVCVVSFLCGLPNITQGGIYFFQLIDYYVAALSLMVLAFFEVIAITWFYGARRLGRNIEEMTGTKPPFVFIVCWYVVSPVLILGIWVFSMIQYKPLSMAGYEYPSWAQGIGWVIALVSIVCIPAGMVHAVIQAKGSNIWKKFKNSLKTRLQEERMVPLVALNTVSSNPPPENKDKIPTADPVAGSRTVLSNSTRENV